MKDRSPLYPGRVTLTPVSGQANTYDMARADQPTEAGTPLNKNTLLKDATAALYGLGSDAVPDDVLGMLAGSLKVEEAQVQDTAIGIDFQSCGAAYLRENSTASNGIDTIVNFNNQTVRYSKDNGKTWTNSELTLHSTTTYCRIAYGNGVFVITDPYYGYSYVSSDGISWTMYTFTNYTSIGGSERTEIAFGNGTFVLLAYQYVYTSSDGQTWTRNNLQNNFLEGKIVFGNGVFIMASRTSGYGVINISFSTDGITWGSVFSTEYITNNVAYVRLLVYCNDRWIIGITCSGINKAYYCIGNENDWVEFSPNAPVSTSDLIAHTCCDGIILYCILTNETYTSVDGISWNELSNNLPAMSDYTTYYLTIGVIVAGPLANPMVSFNATKTAYTLQTPTGENVTDEVAQALGSVKVETGEYTGTNTYGESNPTVLSFNGKPFLVLVLAHQDSSENITYFTPGDRCWGNDSLFWVSGTDKTNVGQSSSSGTVTFIAAGNTLSFYASSAQTQMNASNYKYRYAALTQAGGDT